MFFGLSSDFKPAGVFGWEFIDRKTNEPIENITILLPPKRYTIKENFLITATKTLGGVQIDDYGNDLKDISLGGNVNFFYTAKPPSSATGQSSGPMRVLKDLANQALGAAVDLAQQALPTQLLNVIPGLEVLTGLQEMFRMRFIVSRMRDKYSNASGQWFSPKPAGLKGVDTLYDKFKGKTFKDVKVIYHDWDDNNHFEVVFTSFEIQRTDEDVFSWTYQVEMKTIQEEKSDSLIIGDVGTKPQITPLAQNMADLLTSTIEPLDSTINASTNLADTASNILDGVTSLLSEGGTVNRMLEQRRDKIFRSVENIVTEFNKLASFFTEIDDEQASQESVIADLASPNPTATTFAIDLVESSQDALYEASLAAGLLQQSYSILINLEPYLSNSREVAQNINQSEDTETPTLTDEEFFINEDTIISNQEQTVIQWHEVQAGDTAFSLAKKFYGDWSRYSLIIKENDLFITSFDNNKLVSTLIRIPLPGIEPPNDNTRNQVYSINKPNATRIQRNIALLGNDIELDANGDFVADGSGDIKMLVGSDALIANIKDRLKNERNSLNDQHPGWGVRQVIGLAGNIDTLTLLADAVEAQAEKDPRISSATFRRDNVAIRQDAIIYDLNITAISGDVITVKNNSSSTRVN